MTDKSLAARAMGGSAGLVRLLKRLGPTFVRYGQILALRPDLVPLEFREELLVELAEVPQSLSWGEVRAFLESELKDIDSVFRSIDPVPLFCSGLAQIHPAVTAAGQNVLIKLLPPKVRQRARKDRRRALALGRLLRLERESVDELMLWLDRELDLSAERANIAKLASVSGENPLTQVPRVYPELSSANVLTIGNLGGIPLMAILSPARHGKFKWEGFGYDPHALAAHLIEATMRSILEQHFYCADVYPLNLFLLPGNRVSFINFNHCETLDAGASLLYARFLNDVFSTELPRMALTFEDLLAPTDYSRSEAMREDFIGESHQWLRSAPASNRTRSAVDFSSPLSNWLMAIVRVARRNRFEIPAEMLSVFRTLVSAETIAIRLDATVHLQTTGQEILKDIVLEDVFGRLEPLKIRSSVVNLLAALNSAPEYLNQILTDAAQGKLGLNLSVTEHPHAAATRDRRFKLLAAAIAAVGVAWMIGEPGLPRLGPIPAWRILAAVLLVLYLCMIALWRRLD